MKVFFLSFVIITTVFATALKDEIEQGVLFYKQKQYERALEIFDRVLIKYPKSKRARLEHARVLYAMGRYEEAKKDFLYVLKQNPPPVVCKNIKWFLKKIEKKSKTNFFSGFISIGSSYDNNIENKSDNPVYGTFIDSNRDKRADKFLTAEFGITHTKKLSNALWRNSFYIYDEYEHDKSSDKITYTSFSTQYIFFTNGIRVALPIGLSYTDVASERYVKSLSFSPNITKRFSRNSTLKAKLLFEKNTNKTDSEKDTKVTALNLRWLWSINKFSNMLGVEYKRYKRVNGTRIDISKKRKSVDISTSYPLLSSNILTLFYKNSIDDYDEIDPTILTNRKDNIKNLNISLQQRINKNQSFGVSISKIKNSSNLDIYSYDKKIITLKATQRF